MVHENIETIRTMQELTDAVSAAGVLPGGVRVSFDASNTASAFVDVGFKLFGKKIVKRVVDEEIFRINLFEYE